jgi:hypothetical protein
MNPQGVALATVVGMTVTVVLGSLLLGDERERLGQSLAVLAQDLGNLQQAVEQLEADLRLRDREDADMRRFQAAWSPVLQQFAGPDPSEEIRSLLQREAALLPVATSSWTLPPVSDFAGGPRRLRVQSYSVKVAGALPLVLRWLGRAEERVPLARPQRLELTAFGAGVALETRWLMPIEADKRWGGGP